jgi:hypothetical protein
MTFAYDEELSEREKALYLSGFQDGINTVLSESKNGKQCMLEYAAIAFDQAYNLSVDSHYPGLKERNCGELLMTLWKKCDHIMNRAEEREKAERSKKRLIKKGEAR